MMLYYELLCVLGRVEYDADGCLMVYNFAIVIEFHIVSAIETTIPEHIIDLHALIWRLCVLLLYFNIFCGYHPRPIYSSTLLALLFFDLELFIIQPVFNPLLDITHTLFDLLIMSLNLVTDI